MTIDVIQGDREAEVFHRLGTWLSAALDDPNAGEAFKADIRAWFEAGGDRMEPTTEAAGSASVGVSREEVARLVDPDAWRVVDRHASYVARHTLPLETSRLNSLAKADAILLALRQATPSSDGWEPIDSAPKDGTEILAWWHSEFGGVHGVITWKPYEFGERWFQDDEPVGTPTAWMPIPAAPQVEGEGV